MKKLILCAAVSFTALSIVLESCVSTKVAEKGGAEVWGQNCMRCHNSPSPSSFNDDQWEAVCMHMRLRANLTEDETKKILEFMKSAN